MVRLVTTKKEKESARCRTEPTQKEVARPAAQKVSAGLKHVTAHLRRSL